MTATFVLGFRKLKEMPIVLKTLYIHRRSAKYIKWDQILDWLSSINEQLEIAIDKIIYWQKMQW